MSNENNVLESERISHEESWNIQLDLVKEYTKEHSCLPRDNVLFKGYNIGSWLTTQKNKYKNGFLSSEREGKLREIGVPLDISAGDKLWQNTFGLLKEYMLVNGRFPRVKDSYKGVNLGRWLYMQKEHYRKGTLSSSRVGLLRSIGVELDKTKSDAFEETWHEYLALLQNYVAEHGRLPKTAETYKEYNLGQWLNSQKIRNNQGLLSPARKNLLAEIGVKFGLPQKVVNQDRWDSNFQLLKEYVGETGKLPKRNLVYKGVDIGVWLTSQKSRYKAGIVPHEREALLRSVGVDFEKNLKKEAWENQFRAFKEFLSETGRLPRPSESYNGHKIGQWLKDQKSKHKSGVLSPEREVLLRDAGVEFLPKTMQQNGCLTDLIAEAQTCDKERLLIQKEKNPVKSR